MSEWRDIASAPKDGTGILIFAPERAGFVADQRIIAVHWTEWGSGVWEANTGMGKWSDSEVTHWMPLPAPPTLEPPPAA